MAADTLIDPVSRFDLIATAIAESELAVRTCPAALPTHTDGRTIWINGNDAHNDLDRVREAVVVQAQLLRCGGLDHTTLRRLRRDSAIHRYFGFEVRRALALGSPVPLVRLIANSPAARAAATTSARESAEWAARGHISDATPQHWGTIIPVRLLGAKPVAGGPRSVPTDGQPAEMSDVKSTLVDNDLSNAESETPRRDLFTSLTRRIRNGTTGRRKGSGSGAMIEGWFWGTTTRRRAAGMSFAPVAPTPDHSTAGGALYPEWDVGRGAYRVNWCRVREQPVPQRRISTIEPTSPDIHLQRGLARVARSLSKVPGRREGDDIDLDAVIHRQVSRRTGDHRDHGVHIARLRIKPELTVALLMDNSSSTAEPLRDGRTVFDEQRSAAAALIDAMAAVGMSTAWWSFRSHGRHRVHIERVKSFDEPVNYDTRARAASLRPSGFTRLGAAIRYATTAIDADAGAGHRLLIVLTDGVAYDNGYEGLYADGDVGMALAEARHRQIGCLCLSLGVEHDDSRLRDTFGTADYLRFDSWDTLRRDAAPLLRSAIRAGAGNRPPESLVTDPDTLRVATAGSARN